MRTQKPKIGYKRKLFLAWLAFELTAIAVSLPTAANIANNNISQDLPRIASVDLAQSPGQSRILLASNGPFALLSTGVTGPMHVKIFVTGNINGNIHGRAAQIPGPLKTCAIAKATAQTIIYQSIGKTADRAGHILDQAVVLEITHDASQTPKIELVNLYDKKYQRAKPARSCDS